MTIIEAMKSGKLVRRRSWAEFFDTTFAAPDMRREDVIADDWEWEDKKAEVTRARIISAVAEAYINSPHPVRPMPSDIVEAICKELGL